METDVIWEHRSEGAPPSILICSKWLKPWIISDSAGRSSPPGRSCEGPHGFAASSLLSVTKRMKFLVAVRPGIISPSASARMAATFDRLSNGRLLLNVVTGGDPGELAGDGIHLDHDTRYELTDEFLTVFRRIMQGEKVDFHGRHLHIKGGSLLFPPVQIRIRLRISAAPLLRELKAAAKHADVYLTWEEPPSQVVPKLSSLLKACRSSKEKP